MTGGVRQSRERVGDSGQLPIQARIRGVLVQGCTAAPNFAMQKEADGPGPARYLLPTTVGTNQVDCTKRHSPSFSFGSRRSSFKTDSPGPAYNIDLMGKTNGRSYSFGIKPKTPVRKNQSPGPGAYDTDVRPLWEKCAPQYSISPRTRKRSVDAVPSPSTYMLSSTLGANVADRRGGPAITIGGRSEKHGFAEDLAKTPGPAKYGAYSPSLTKRRSPEYTVKGRNFMPASKNVVPGPGAYSPQDVNTYLEQSPRHVIAIRHSEFMMPTMTQADI